MFCIIYFISDQEDLLTKSVNGLVAALNRIENEIKHHQQPKSPIDKFGDIMTVSFRYIASVMFISYIHFRFQYTQIL